MNSQQTEAVRNYRSIEALVPAHWQSGSIVTGDQARIHFHRTGGNKPPLIALHGFQSAGLTWLRTAKALEADYDVIMPDFRGHGFSSESVQGFSLERLTDDIHKLIEALGLEKPFVMGHSLGAEIAGRLAASYPNNVRAVLLVDPPMRVFVAPKLDSNAPWLKQWFATMQAIKSQPHEERLQTGLRLLPPNMAIPDEEHFVPYVEAQTQFNLDVLQYATVMNYSVATPEIAGRISCPVLLLTGNPQRGSGAIPDGIAALTTTGTQREAITFEDAGHFVQVEQPERFVQAVKDFLARY